MRSCHSRIWILHHSRRVDGPCEAQGQGQEEPHEAVSFRLRQGGCRAPLLPTVILVGRPNVGKSALFNREALVYNTPGDHVTRDIHEGIAKFGDLRFCVLHSAGLETAATSGSILARTADMTWNVLARDGLQPLDLEIGEWLGTHASGIHTIVAMNKSESLDEHGVLTAAAGEAHRLGFGDPVAISVETGLGMAELYETLSSLFEDDLTGSMLLPLWSSIFTFF
ncbi:hypothetical protein ABZP36_025533 [Zizania latifolia]